MKKILLLLLTLFLVTGCESANNTVNKIDVDKIFNTFLSKETKLVNTASNGYKYYLPSGVRLIESNNYNDKLFYNGYYYYLFIDTVSYYYNTSPEYNINPSLFYSNILSYNGKTGYAEIEENDGLYRIKIYYNYASIETYVDYGNIKQTITNMCYILNSIKFNDVIVKLTVGDDDTLLSEETFDFYTPRKEGNFIDYINKYDQYKEKKENGLGNEESE